MANRLTQHETSTSSGDLPWGAFRPKGWRGIWVWLGKNTPLGRGSLRRVWVKRLVQSGVTADVSVKGVPIRLQIGDNRSEIKALVQGDDFMRHEREALEAARAEAADRLYVVDIGANAGLFSAIALHVAAGKGTVLAIEPNPALLQRLETNIELSRGESEAVIEGVAVGSENATLPLTVHDDDLGGGSFVNTSASTKDLQHKTVTVRPLLELIRSAKMPRIDVLKIDVEGYEDESLVPFFETVNPSLFPRTILMEVTHSHLWKRDLWAVLETHNYQIAEERGADITLTRPRDA
ncbi:MAG: FkbM family methyltransferase [Pseudomonadota bacterium]